MATHTQTRVAYRPRRKRSDNPPPFQITARDIDILRAVARYRFLNSKHVCCIVGGSPKNVRNRLKGLFEHAYLDRPECQYDFYRPGGGSSLVVYALADKGARLLIHEDGFGQTPNVAWGQKNRAVGRPFLEHTLAIADFAVDLRDSAGRNNTLELLDGPELIARMPSETQEMAKPLRASVALIVKGARHVISVEPDYAFSLGFPAQRLRANYLVEIDRGTMPVERADLGATSILRKFLAYQAIWRNKIHLQQFGWRNFRVLFVTTDPERAGNMQDCLRHHVGAQGSVLFWFADHKTMKGDCLLHHTWVDGSASPRLLVPNATK